MRSVWTRGLVLVAAALLAHAVFSAFVAAAMYWGYPHRIYDIRRWAEPRDVRAVRGEQSDLVAGFLASRRFDPLFVGSSFTFGYPWQEDAIFTRIFGRGANVSVVGYDLADIHNIILCNLEKEHPRRLVLEIPVVNTVNHPGADLRCQRSDTHGYYAFALHHPIGSGWFRFLWDNEAYPKPDEPVQIAPVPDDYFATDYDREKFSSKIVAVLNKAKSVAGTVYVLPSPVYLPGVAQVGRNAQAVREQLDFAVRTCRQVPGVVCLDPTPFYDMPEYFYNMTHLSQRGHRAMAQWLAAVVLE